MSRFTAAYRLTHGQTVLPFTLSALCCALLSPAALAETSTGPVNELSPTVVTAVAPSSPLTVVTHPKDPRQPVPASDGGDYLKTIPGFALIRNGGTNGDPVLR
ncbi:MAG: TonB-dependent copper receptor, partial [Pseudomonas taetrolens]